MNFTATQIQHIVGGNLIGDPELIIHGFAPIESVSAHTLCFADGHKYEAMIDASINCLYIIGDHYTPLLDKATYLLVSSPRMAMQQLLVAYNTLIEEEPSGLEQPHTIHPSATIGDEVYVGAYTYIGAHTTIGNKARIYPQVYIGKNVVIGHDTILYPGVKIYDGTVIGSHCIIHAGAVIGSDGFGFIPNAENKLQKIPQIGKVCIEDYVEIGANTCIDRGALGNTIIQAGTKLDNLIQVAHNVVIGNDSALAAQAGIAGSTTIGSGCMIGGQVGITGHINIADGTKINAQSGVSKSVTIPSQSYTGTPAREYRAHYKSLSHIQNIPLLMEKIKALEDQLASMNNRDHAQ